MAQPQITYRGIPHSPAMDAKITELAARLEELHPKITRCHVVVLETDRHKQKGNLFQVHVDLHVPGHDVVATQKASEDAYVAITGAFEAASRQLEDVARIRRGEVKAHREERGDNTTP
jgi:ribosome-associated translation inhibitor RaiA